MSSSAYQYLTDNKQTIPDATDMRIGIVVAEWNNDITDTLLNGAVRTLCQCGVNEANITIKHVPGSFELVYGCAQLAEHGFVDAVIAIGCVIKGDTPHFDHICSATVQGITALNQTGKIPVIYGVLTVNNHEQAEERAGGKLGNKGDEFAVTAIKMVDYAWSLQK